MLSICTRKHPWMDTDIVDLKAPLPYPDRHWPVTLCMRFVWWLKDGEFQSVMSELRRVSRAVVYSVRVSEKYGPGLNHKSLAHTPAMVFEANGGWRVTHCIDVTRNYRVLRIEP
ncbi:hypothetical protein [Panacagrimonas sp.]|uniref:hypothetical protein n=1 Tax=Panacagrimonas sp. TaxID=2480088 RepID=UPI003B528A81